MNFLVDLSSLSIRVALACGKVTAKEDLAALYVIVDRADLIAETVVDTIARAIAVACLMSP